MNTGPKNPWTHEASRQPELGAEVLDAVEVPLQHADVVLASGRRYELHAGTRADQLVVRGRGGDVVLRVEITDQGPVLTMSGATLELSATRELVLQAERIAMTASGDMTLDVGGNVAEVIAGDRRVSTGGVDRLEASALELQADGGGVRVKAREAISLDGEHIGLNDDPRPAPFAWSRAAEADEKEEP